MVRESFHLTVFVPCRRAGGEKSFHLTVSVPCRKAGGVRVISPVSVYIAGGLVVRSHFT